MSERVDDISPVAGKQTVAVRIGEEAFEIAGSASVELELRPGLEVTPGLRSRIAAAASRRAAAADGLRYLRGRPRTELEVRDRLRACGHAPPVVEAVLGELRQGGLVDDARYAEWFVGARLAHRPAGVVRLVREMCERGVPKPVAQAAALRALRERSEEALALQAARPRFAAVARLGRERGLRRLAGFLTGRGFSEETVRSVCLRLFDSGAPREDTTLEPGAPEPEEP